MVTNIKDVVLKSISELIEFNKVEFVDTEKREELEYEVEYQRAFEDPIEITKMIFYTMLNFVKKNKCSFYNTLPIVFVKHKKKTIKIKIMMEINL